MACIWTLAREATDGATKEIDEAAVMESMLIGRAWAEDTRVGKGPSLVGAHVCSRFLTFLGTAEKRFTPRNRDAALHVFDSSLPKAAKGVSCAE